MEKNQALKTAFGFLPFLLTAGALILVSIAFYTVISFAISLFL